MKKFLTFLCAAVIALSLFGCMSPEEKQTQEGLLDYINEINALETDINLFYDQLQQLGNTSDTAAAIAMLDEDILPTLGTINDSINAISIEDEKIAEVHQEMVDAWGQMQTALDQMHQCLETDDLNGADSAFSQIDEAETGFETFAEDLQALCNDYNIDLKME